MHQALKIIAIVIIGLGLFTGIRFIGTTIHYGCHRQPITNVEDGDDCPPPFWAVAQIIFYATGGSLNPLWNRDETTVSSVSWNIEKANPAISNPNDFHFYEQTIAADVTTYDGKTKRYELGNAYGCTGTTTSILQNNRIEIGRVDCYYALTGTTFIAFSPHGDFRIERYDESAKDGSIKTTVLVQI